MDYEKRLERIEDKQDSEIKESSEFRGELRQFMANSDSFTKAVSAKVDGVRIALDAHKTDPDAHGAGVRRDVDIKFWGIVTAIGGFSGLIGAFFHRVMGGGSHVGP